MGHERAIRSGKEHRKPYRDTKASDYTCRNHGGCFYCRKNRMHGTQKRMEVMRQKITENDFMAPNEANIGA